MTLKRKELPGFVAAAILRRCRAEEVIVDLVDAGLSRVEATQYLDNMLAINQEMTAAGAVPTEESLVAEWTCRQVAAKQQRAKPSVNSDEVVAVQSSSPQVITAELLPSVSQPEMELSDEQYETISKLSRYMGIAGGADLIFGCVAIIAGLATLPTGGVSRLLSGIAGIWLGALTMQAVEPFRQILESRRDVNRRLFTGLNALVSYYYAQIILMCGSLVVIVFAVLILAGSSRGLRHF